MPQLEHPSNSRGANSNLTLLLIQKLPSLLWKDRCAASNHHSSDVISSWSLTWYYCYFYSLSETRRGGCSGFHFPTTICQSNWTLDRTFNRLCGLLNPVHFPSATGNPKKLSPVISANPQERTHFLSDSRRIQGHTAPLVASWVSPPTSVLVSHDPVDLSKAHAASCSH